ncbi:MAG: hypothetical protein QOH97_4991 [Actinoplanes sp.]|nr:hypothetical protein [Actinoplanes sp.]
MANGVHNGWAWPVPAWPRSDGDDARVVVLQPGELVGHGVRGQPDAVPSPILAAVSSTAAGSGISFFGKLVRTMLGLVVIAAAAGVATHAMGLWQIAEPTDPPMMVRPVAKAVSVPGRTVTILGAGSILPAPEIWDQARRDGGGSTLDFGLMMAGARKAVSGADLALCHLSAPLAATGGPYSGLPRYNVPAEAARAIADTGFDGCATAAEHAFDQGSAGVARTLDALDRAEVGHSGTYRVGERSPHPKIYTANGVKVAHLSYTIDLNGQKVPAGRQATVARPTPTRIENDARDARAAGAAIVVVSVDWGTDGEHEPDVDEQELARTIATMRDVDLVFGHGAHVAQPVERIGDKWIIYGLGDFAARHPQPVYDNREGSMMRVTFSPAQAGRWTVAAIEALPTFIDLNPNIRIVDLEQALADPAVPAGRRTIYQAAVDHLTSHLQTRMGSDSLLQVRATDK